MSQSKEKFDLDRLVLTTKSNRLFHSMSKWEQRHPLWFLPVGTACCALEYRAALPPCHIAESLESMPPSLADLMIVSGTVTEKQLPIILQIYHRMPRPKWVMALGACAAGGGPYLAYNVVQGIDREIPVDVYVPGCPPTPESIITAIGKIRNRIEKGLSAAAAPTNQSTANE